MKKLGEYIKNQYISLKDIDESIVEKLKNLNGQQINECYCDCCCGCEPKCCSCGGSDQFIFFYSEDEIINKLKTKPIVQDIFNIHNQFGRRFEFYTDEGVMADVFVPLYFRSYMMRCSAAPDSPACPANSIVTSISASSNKKLYDFINSLVSSHKFTYPTIATFDNGDVQVYLIKGCGTNGQEGSIKSSLTEVAKLLDKLDKTDGITWSQVLDVSIDNLDDVYNFLVTFTVDMNQFPAEIKTIVKPNEDN